MIKMNHIYINSCVVILCIFLFLITYRAFPRDEKQIIDLDYLDEIVNFKDDITKKRIFEYESFRETFWPFIRL